MGAYDLDERLLLVESTRQFSEDGRGSEAPKEGSFVVAIRKRGHRDCLFRFSHRDRADARLMLEALNRDATDAAAPQPGRYNPTA